MDTQNSNPASISFINIEQNSSGPLSCSLCAKKMQTYLMVMNVCVALHVPRSQPMQLLVTCSHLCSNNPSIIIIGLPFSGRCSAFWHACSAETQEHDSRVHYFCTTYQSTHTQTLYSHIPRPCAFVACSTKFCANFVLQATNAQVLGTRLVGLQTPPCFTCNTHIYYCKLQTKAQGCLPSVWPEDVQRSSCRSRCRGSCRLISEMSTNTGKS